MIYKVPTGVYTQQHSPVTPLGTPESWQPLNSHGPDVCPTVASENQSHQSVI